MVGANKNSFQVHFSGLPGGSERKEVTTVSQSVPMHVKLDSQVKVNNHNEPVRASNNGVGFGYGYGANSLDEANDEVGDAIAGVRTSRQGMMADVPVEAVVIEKASVVEAE